MRIIKKDNVDIQTIVEALKQGSTIVYPTETCYGLGADATNQTSVDRVFAIKERQNNKTMLVIMPDIEMVLKFIQWNATLGELAERYWPGPLTMVAPAMADSGLAQGIIGLHNMVAFRVTSHPLAKALSKSLGKPLVSTSANITSLESPYDIESVRTMFDARSVQPDIVIDAGTLPHKSPSTIVRVTNDVIEILRQGEIIVEER